MPLPERTFPNYRASKLMQLRNVLQRILKLQNCERVGRVVPEMILPQTCPGIGGENLEAGDTLHHDVESWRWSWLLLLNKSNNNTNILFGSLVWLYPPILGGETGRALCSCGIGLRDLKFIEFTEAERRRDETQSVAREELAKKIRGDGITSMSGKSSSLISEAS